MDKVIVVRDADLAQDLAAQTVVPYEVYIKAGTAEAAGT